MEQKSERGTKVQLDKTNSPKKGWEVEIYFQDGFYHVKSAKGAKSFYKFYRNNSLAWKAYYAIRQEFSNEN